MTVVDLHPEDLLDKDASGQLNDAERVRLQSHLARCATCRFERQLRADFAGELQAEEAPEELVGLTPDRRKPVAGVRRVRSGWRFRTRTAWLLAAATLLVGSVAAATGVTRRIWSAPTELVSASVPALSEANEAKKMTKAPRPAQHVESPAEPVAAVPEAQPAPTAPVESSPALTEVTSERAHPVPAPLVPRPALRVSDMIAPDLLDAEGDARRQGDYDRVVSLHRQLVSRYPSSREAQVSRATVGRLLLDRGNPADALTSFDAYLGAGAGALEEEALVGRATALERLGRRDEASRAWGDLLAAFPETPYAAHARTRLGGLSGN